MIRVRSMLIATALGLASFSGIAQAQVCTGDCNLNEIVTINELIVGVNISLGNSPVTACEPFDANDSGTVTINELIAAVSASLNGCGDEPEGFCGDGEENVTGEECDDGNNFGGDTCAANCTDEIRRTTTLDPARSSATVQAATLTVPLNLRGTQVLTAGMPRDTDVDGPDGKLFNAGDIPIVIKAADVRFEPIPVFGIVCACVRGVAVPEFGTAISGTGKAACGTQPLQNVDFTVVADHNTTPGSAGNGGTATGLPDDPDCTATFETFPGVFSPACLEGTGAACSTPDNTHIGPPAACISPRVINYSGGAAPRGSVSLLNNSAIGLLEDGATCAESRLPNGMCRFADYGPDCMPCTDDDVEKGVANLSPTISGTAAVVIHDFANTAGRTIQEGSTCGGTAACVTKVTGEAIQNCAALLEDPQAPLSAVLVTAFPGIDTATLGDTITTTTLAPTN